MRAHVGDWRHKGGTRRALAFGFEGAVDPLMLPRLLRYLCQIAPSIRSQAPVCFPGSVKAASRRAVARSASLDWVWERTIRQDRIDGSA